MEIFCNKASFIGAQRVIQARFNAVLTDEALL
jgi:hypothetical protein